MATVKITGLADRQAEDAASWLALKGIRRLESWLEYEGHRLCLSAPINYGASPVEIEVIARQAPYSASSD